MHSNLDILKLNLENKGYRVLIFENKVLAAAYINKAIDNLTVGFGGSVTLHEMNLFPSLSQHNTVYWHDEKPGDMTVMQTRKAAADAEVYISSVNAISLDGEIVNIDYTGNRVAAISFGPSKVYLIFGINKITADLNSAIYRARNTAAPLNAKRLNRKTPCAKKADKCYNCKSPERICRNFSVLTDKPAGPEYEIIIIKEKLGY